MRLIALFAVSFVLGFALGGWTPRGERNALELRIEELQAQLREKKAFDGNPSLSGITRMLNVPEPPGPAEPEPVTAPADDAGDAAEVAAADAPAPAPAEPEEPDRPRNLRGHIEQAADLWGVRSDLARQAFLDNIAASDDQALRFDVLMEAMNVRLEAAITDWAQVLAADTMPPREAGIRMMRDITEALVITYDELDRSLPSRWKRDAGDSFQIVDYIDPIVALPLAEVEEKLDFE